MNKFIDYIKSQLAQLETSWEEEREAIINDYCFEKGEDMELYLDQRERDFLYQIRYLVNICYDRCLPESFIDEIFGDYL